MSYIEKLVEKLNEGVMFYYKTPFINLVGTKKLMKEAAEKLESMQDDIERLTNVLVEAEARADNLEKRAEAHQSEIDALKLTNEEIMQETKAVIVRMQGKIDALKSGEPFGWLFEEKHVSPRWIYNNRLTGSAIGPSVDFLEQHKDKLTQLFKHSKPIHKPLTNEQIENIQSKIPDWDDHEYSLSFARAIETKVRSQYEI